MYHRSKNTLDRMARDPLKLQAVCKSMQAYIDRGHVERVPSQTRYVDAGAYWFLPILPVFHPEKESVRLVFDAAAKFKGTCLNDKLLCGPDLNNTLQQFF